MSSFMISNNCMNNIINGLFWNNDFKRYYSDLYKQQNLNDSKDFEKLAKKLFKLNQKALLERYPQEKRTPTDYIEIPKFIWNGKNPPIYQFLKSLHCLKYQCCEGNITKTKLYKWIDDVINCLQSYIINKLPEYDLTKWN